MYVTMGRDRLCTILWHVVMPPIALGQSWLPIERGQTWLCQPLLVSTVPNTGMNLSRTVTIEDSMMMMIIIIAFIIIIAIIIRVIIKIIIINL